VLRLQTVVRPTFAQVALGLVTVLVGVACTLAVVGLKSSFDQLRLINDIHLLGDKLIRLNLAVQDVRVASRGYALSGTSDFLTAYRDTLPHVENAMSEVIARRGVHDIPAEHMSQLEDVVRSSLVSAEALVNTRALHGADAASREVRTGVGQDQIQDVARIIDNLHRLDMERIELREEHVRATMTSTLGNMSLGGLLVVMLVGVSVVLAVRHRRSRQAVERSLRELMVALQHTVEGIARVNRDGTVISANATFARLFGDEPLERNKVWDSIGGEAGRQKLEEGVVDVARTGEASVELVANRADGSVYHLSVLMVGVYLSDGKYDGHFRFVKDVSEKRESELALQKSERRSRTLTDRAPVGIFETDAHGFRTYTNPRWREMGGRSHEQIMGHGWLQAVHRDDRAHVEASWCASMRDGTPWNAEYRLVTPDEEVRWVRGASTPLHSQDGRVTGHIGIDSDITILKTSEAVLIDKTERLRLSNIALEQFAYIASHDLQEPLRMVSNYTQLLDRRYRGKLDATADEYIGFAVEGAKRMRSLIDDVLDYSRLGHNEPSREEVDLGALFTEAVGDFAGRIDETRAIVTSDPLPVVQGDANQLRQLLQNLLGNALKFVGTAPPNVHVHADHGDEHWLVSVSDNGIGIDPAVGERIFDVFHRLHGRGRYPGNGIGLAVCKRVVENHGGRIWMDSAPGRGTSFHFTLQTSPSNESAHHFESELSQR